MASGEYQRRQAEEAAPTPAEIAERAAAEREKWPKARIRKAEQRKPVETRVVAEPKF